MARIGLAVAGFGMAAAMSACGGGDSGDDGFTDQSANDIVADAKAAMKDLKSVKVEGTIASGGEELSLDLQSSDSGDCTGTVEVADGKVEVVGTGGDTWFRADEAFWRKQTGAEADQIISMVGDKWVVDTPGNFATFCDLDGFLEELTESDDKSSYKKSGTDEVDGEEVVLIDQEDSEEGPATASILVDEPHYLIEIEKSKGEDTGDVTFSDFNEDFEVHAPSKDEVVDLGNTG